MSWRNQPVPTVDRKTGGSPAQERLKKAMVKTLTANMAQLGWYIALHVQPTADATCDWIMGAGFLAVPMHAPALTYQTRPTHG